MTRISQETGRRTRKLILSAILLFAITTVLIAIPTCKSSPPKRNVILITIDTLRADRLGCYGSKTVETPHIDALAAKGTLFEETITPVPLTLPSHASILTGRYPAEHGVRDNGFYRLPEGYPTLATRFKKAGYNTAAIVASHTLNDVFGLDRDFDFYDDLSVTPGTRAYAGDRSERPADEITNQAIDWIDENSERPFFMWVHYFDPHSPYLPPSPYREKYRGHPYEGEVAFTDREIGKLLDKLRDSGLDPKTLVVLTADHGEALGEHGEKSHGIFLYRSSMHVPLIFTGPGVPPGKRISAMVGLIDICPSVLSYSGLADGFACSGRDLFPIITGRVIPTGKPVFIETEGPANLMGWSPLKGLRTPRYKYIDGPAFELYDMDDDPSETRNLYKSKRDIAEKMRKKIAYMEGLFAKHSAGFDSSFSPDDKNREALESLGYVGERVSTAASRTKNPADMKKLLALYYEVEGHHRRGEWELSLNSTARALQLDPENIRILMVAAYSNHRLDRLETAADIYEKLLPLDPRLIAVWSDLSSVYSKLGRTDDAIVAAKRALELDPNLTHALYMLGSLYEQKGLTEEPVRYYRRALEIDPDYEYALRAMGKILRKSPETREKGDKMIERARKITAENKKAPGK